MHDFIEDRNHVAHSKVLSLSAYKVIEKEFSDMDALIKNADMRFDKEEASNELAYTWDIEQDELETLEEENAYYRDRMKEAGIDVLDGSRIKEWFDEKVHNDLYSIIYQRYHLDNSYVISDFTAPSEGVSLFSVSCNVDQDGEKRIEIYAECDIDDSLSGDSICVLFAKDDNGKVICKAEISIHNGNGSERENGIIEHYENTEYNDLQLNGFREELIVALDEMSRQKK